MPWPWRYEIFSLRSQCIRVWLSSNHCTGRSCRRQEHGITLLCPVYLNTHTGEICIFGKNVQSMSPLFIHLEHVQINACLGRCAIFVRQIGRRCQVALISTTQRDGTDITKWTWPANGGLFTPLVTVTTLPTLIESMMTWIAYHYSYMNNYVYSHFQIS